jgi:hypothetical protein
MLEAGDKLDARTDYEGGTQHLRTSVLRRVTDVLGGLSSQLDILSSAFEAVPWDLRRLPDVQQIGRLGELVDRLNRFLDDGRMVAIVRQGAESVDLTKVHRAYGPWPWEQKDFAYSISSMTMFGIPWEETPETVAGLWVTKFWPLIDYNVYRIGLKDLRGTLVNSWPTLDGTGRTGGDADWNDALRPSG